MACGDGDPGTQARWLPVLAVASRARAYLLIVDTLCEASDPRTTALNDERHGTRRLCTRRRSTGRRSTSRAASGKWGSPPAPSTCAKSMSTVSHASIENIKPVNLGPGMYTCDTGTMTYMSPIIRYQSLLHACL